MRSYAWRELARNPRRTLVSMAGVALGVGLFSGLLFFIDGSGATMTARALAPLSLDMQRVLTAPLGGGLRLEEHLAPLSRARAGDSLTVSLRVVNGGADTAHDVVVGDQPPPPLRYIPESTQLGGRPIRDVARRSPLSQGIAGLGFNIGTIPPATAVTITYKVRAERATRPTAVRLRGSVSSRESVVPTAANTHRAHTLEQVRAQMERIPGVATADGLSFVDLPAGSLSARGIPLDRPVRVFAFDARYRDHYPSIRIVRGGFRVGAALVSAEASRALRIAPRDSFKLRLPAGRRLLLPVGGVADLSGARPLFSSRRARSLEDFLYVPIAVVVDPSLFERAIIPALRSGSAALGGIAVSLPVEEVDVRVKRERLHAEPAAALTQTRAVARAIARIAPGQDYLVDNISNTLIVATADAAVGKRMFVFLGLPAILLAALLTAYAGGVLAASQRREQANLRVRGADRSHLSRLLAYRTLVVAGAGSVVGGAAGFAAALILLGADDLSQAPSGALASSALIAIGGGMLVTVLALLIPGRRSLQREIGQERQELAFTSEPAWRRLRLDLVMLGIAILAETIAWRAGALNGRPGSAFNGRSVSLNSYLVVIPLAAGIGGVLLSARLLLAFMRRLPLPSPPDFGKPVPGALLRSLRRRSWESGAGIVALGLVVAFGTSLRAFSATYDHARRADARFLIGSDLRITPGAQGLRASPAIDASQLRVRGVSDVTPVVFRSENSVVIGPYDRSRTDLAAIDPGTFGRAAPLAASSFDDLSAHAALAALSAHPDGVLLDAATADDLSIVRGDRIRVVLALGTGRQTVARFRVVGLFSRFTGFARPPNLIVRLDAYAAATTSNRIDFFFARTIDHGHADLTRAMAAIRSGPGRRHALTIESTETAIDRDQSSLTALNIRSLVDLGSAFTLLMSAAVIGIFAFGMLLGRRREYVAMRAQGMQYRELAQVVYSEVAIVAAGGLAAGLLAGTGATFLLVQILRPLFILPPGVALPPGALATLALSAAVAASVAACAVGFVLQRLRPAEILREQ